MWRDQECTTLMHNYFYTSHTHAISLGAHFNLALPDWRSTQKQITPTKYLELPEHIIFVGNTINCQQQRHMIQWNFSVMSPQTWLASTSYVPSSHWHTTHTCSLLCWCLDSCSCCFMRACNAAEPTTGTGMNLRSVCVWGRRMGWYGEREMEKTG